MFLVCEKLCEKLWVRRSWANLQGWTAARSQSRRLMTRLRLSYRQRASWQGRRQGNWMNGSRLARRVFGNQTEASRNQAPSPCHIAHLTETPCAIPKR